MCLRQYAYGRNIRLQIRYVKFYSTNKIYTGVEKPWSRAYASPTLLGEKEKAEFLAWKQNCNMFNKSRGSRVIRVQLKPHNFFCHVRILKSWHPLLSVLSWSFPFTFPGPLTKLAHPQLSSPLTPPHTHTHTHFPVHSYSIVIIH